MRLLGEKLLPVAAALVFLVLCIPSAASQSQGTSSFDVEDMETDFGDRNITFSTSYTNHSLSYGQVLVPDELRSSLVDVRTPGNPRSMEDGVAVFQPPGQQGKSLKLAYQFSNSVPVEELKDWTYGEEQGRSGMLQGETVDLDLDNSSKTDVFSAGLTDGDISWSIDVRSHYEHLIVDYRLIENISATGNSSNNGTEEVIWEGQDVYRGEETSVVPFDCSNTRGFTEDEVRKQSVTLCPDNQYDDSHEVTVLTAYPEQYNHSQFSAEGLESVAVNDAQSWYSNAEQQVLENDLNQSLLIPEKQLEYYQFKAYNLTLPEDSTSRLTSKIVTGQENTVKGLKMYVIGSIGGTTTYESSSGGSSIYDSWEDGDHSEYTEDSSPTSGQVLEVRSGSNAYDGDHWLYTDQSGDSNNFRLSRSLSSVKWSTFGIAYQSVSSGPYTNMRLRLRKSGNLIMEIDYACKNNEIMVNSKVIGSCGNSYKYVNLKDIDYTSNEIGSVELGGSEVATNIAFLNNADNLGKLRLVVTGAGSSAGRWDFATRKQSNSPPTFNEVNSYPVNWSIQTPIDFNVSATDSDSPISSVWAKVQRGDDTVKSWTKADNLSETSYYGFQDFYTPPISGNYSLLIKANDTKGSYNRTNTTQFLQKANLNLLLEDPENKATRLTPVQHQFGINCFSVGGCSKASLLLNYTGNKSYSFLTESNSDWDTGSYTDTESSDSSLILTESISDLFEGFESGNLNDWSTSGSMNIKTSGSPAVRTGSYSAGSWGDGTLGSTLTICEGGCKPDSAEFYWYESSSQTGQETSFLDSNENLVHASGNNNPQWEIKDGDGSTTVYNGDGYLRWIYYRFDYDWANCEYTYYFEDTQSGASRTGTRSMDSCKDIETFRISDNYFGVTADHVVFDDITVSQVPQGYASTGEYRSRTFKHSDPINWETSKISSNTPSGTSIEVDYGTNETGTWKYFDTVQDLPKTSYTKFNATLSTSDTSVSPTVDSVQIDGRREQEVFREVKSITNVVNSTVNNITYNYSSITSLSEKHRPMA